MRLFTAVPRAVIADLVADGLADTKLRNRSTGQTAVPSIDEPHSLE